jgi:hypothetical protein
MTEATDGCIECGKSRAEIFRGLISRGRCSNCYQRHLRALKKSGEYVEPVRDPRQRLFSKAVPGRNGCIIWTGRTNPVTGYGQLRVNGRDCYAHRVSYELAKGTIPDGLVIDHACHNRDASCKGGDICIHHRCINPHHLDAVTQSENRIRSPHTKNLKRELRTHCHQGHEYTPENTLTWASRRACRTCHNLRAKRYRAERQAHSGDSR